MAEQKPFYQRPRIIVAIILGLLLLLFAVQNAGTVELKLGPFTFTGRRFIIIAFSFLTGFAISTAFWWRRGFPKG